MFKTGDYVPLAILVVDRDNKLKNVHLSQQLFAIKDFAQADMLTHYFFQHPQQPVMLDQHNPQVAEFNGAVTNLHQWLIKNGYCTQEGGTDIISRVWTQDEVQAARDELKARRDAQVLAHAEAMAAAGDEGMEISQGINNLLGGAEVVMAEGQKMYAEFEQAALEQDRPAVNVGTVGHVDHGQSALSQLVEQRSAASADEPEAFLLQEPPTHELPEYQRLLLEPGTEVVRRAPQYPLPVTAAE
jgi:hypothetical protein